jgi:hypothetical protein
MKGNEKTLRKLTKIFEIVNLIILLVGVGWGIIKLSDNVYYQDLNQKKTYCVERPFGCESNSDLSKTLVISTFNNPETSFALRVVLGIVIIVCYFALAFLAIIFSFLFVFTVKLLTLVAKFFAPLMAFLVVSVVRIFDLFQKSQQQRKNLIVEDYYTSIFLNLLEITQFLYSSKNQQSIFEQMIGDFQEEYYEAIENKQEFDTELLFRTYLIHFLISMWLKSPLEDFMEFIKKIIKQ